MYILYIFIFILNLCIYIYIFCLFIHFFFYIYRFLVFIYIYIYSVFQNNIYIYINMFVHTRTRTCNRLFRHGLFQVVWIGHGLGVEVFLVNKKQSVFGDQDRTKCVAQNSLAGLGCLFCCKPYCTQIF